MSPDEVDTDDRKLNGGQEESPLEAAAIQDELDSLVTPTSYGEAISPIRAGPDGCVDERCGRMLKAAPVSTRKRLLDSWSVT